MRFIISIPLILWLLLVSLMGYGWAVNVYDLAHMHEGITGLLALRVVGIFIAPLGSILGYWV